jgi:hypothetical protein
MSAVLPAVESALISFAVILMGLGAAEWAIQRRARYGALFIVAGIIVLTFASGT